MTETLKDSLKESSLEYYLFKQITDRIQSTENPDLRERYDNGKLVYLDDDIQMLRAFISILSDIAESDFDNAPNHLKGDLRSLDVQAIKDILSEHNLLSYGRSGMRLNAGKLQSID